MTKNKGKFKTKPGSKRFWEKAAKHYRGEAEQTQQLNSRLAEEWQEKGRLLGLWRKRFWYSVSVNVGATIGLAIFLAYLWLA